MACVATEKDPSICSRSDECCHVSNGMAGAVQYVQRAIVEVIICLELANLKVVAEGYFDDISTRKRGLWKRGAFQRWISWQERLPKAWSDIELDVLGESTCVSRVVEMPVAQDHGTDLVHVNSSFRENLVRVLGDPQSRDMPIDQIDDMRNGVIPVFASP